MDNSDKNGIYLVQKGRVLMRKFEMWTWHWNLLLKQPLVIDTNGTNYFTTHRKVHARKREAWVFRQHLVATERYGF